MGVYVAGTSLPSTTFATGNVQSSAARTDPARLTTANVAAATTPALTRNFAMAVSSLFLTIDHFPIEGEYAPSSGWLRQDRRIFGLARIVRARLAYGRPACYRRRSAAGL